MARYDNDNIKKLESLPILGEKPSSEKEEKFLREINEYIFQNIETPNLSVSFPYGNTKNSVNLMLMHGAKYKMPRFLARHIENASKPIYDMKPDVDGIIRLKETGRQPRFQMRQVYSKG
jgi:hypothetical protein